MRLWKLLLRCAVVLGGVVGGAGLAALRDATPTHQAAAVEVADLKDQLKSGLFVRRPEEHAFIDRVVRMVEQERLPVDLVKSVFQWARKQKKRYPFPYFERALRLRAAELGLSIDE